MKERLNQLLDRVGVAWEALSERERLMVGSLGGVLGVFILFLAWFLTASAITDRHDKLDGMYAALSDIEGAAAEYGEREGARKAHELRLDREVPSLKGHLEEVATAAGTPIDSFGSEKRAPAKGKKYDEVTVEVKFRRVELPKITDFMKRVEGDREFAFVIRRLNMRVDFSDKALLNVEMEVATYIRTAPLEKPPEPPPGEAGVEIDPEAHPEEAAPGATGAGSAIPPRKPSLRPGPVGVAADGVGDVDFGTARPVVARPPPGAGPIRPVSGSPGDRAAAAAAARGAAVGRPPVEFPTVKLPAPPKDEE